jgi:NitT/TauT family transport system permease protein
LSRRLPFICISVLAIALFLPVGNSAGYLARSQGLDPAQMKAFDECWTGNPFIRPDCTYFWPARMAPFILALVAMGAAASRFWRGPASVASTITVAGALAGALAILLLFTPFHTYGLKAPGIWVFIIGLALLTWQALGLLAEATSQGGFASALVAGLFGCWLIFLWQVVVVGFGVPQILLPAPTQIGHQLVAQTGMLWEDFQQTFLKSVLAGFAMGCGLGFFVALLTDRVPFLQRGLLPLGNMVSAVPIVGIAPIMVMWFGFGWESKAAVIVVMTFFPMLINTIAGLNASDHMERDLMRSYGSSYWQTFFMLRLPAALPFIFNALKINSTLALIGAIVAEMFGSPISGMGFRISTEVYKMNVDIVWATIAVAAVAGSAFYGLLALIERRLTFWHPSYRSKSYAR